MCSWLWLLSSISSTRNLENELAWSSVSPSLLANIEAKSTIVILLLTLYSWSNNSLSMKSRLSRLIYCIRASLLNATWILGSSLSTIDLVSSPILVTWLIIPDVLSMSDTVCPSLIRSIAASKSFCWSWFPKTWALWEYFSSMSCFFMPGLICEFALR